MKSFHRGTILLLALLLLYLAPIAVFLGKGPLLDPLWRAIWDTAEYDPYIRWASLHHGLDFHLIKAMIRVESSFDREARSPRGAMGLMQLMPGTAKDMGVRDPFDPRQNIDGGARYLKAMLRRFNNNLTLALAAYNAGPETVRRYGGVPPYPETQRYLTEVLTCYAGYRERAAAEPRL